MECRTTFLLTKLSNFAFGFFNFSSMVARFHEHHFDNPGNESQLERVRVGRV